MDSIPKFLSTVIVIIFAVLLCVSFIISAVVVDSARSYHASVIDHIEASDFNAVIKNMCISTAADSNYLLTIEEDDDPTSDTYKYQKVTLTYGLYAPIFGQVHTGNIVGYALAGAHLGGADSSSDDDGPEPGLYETGSNYTKLLIPWDELLRDGVVSVSGTGVVSSQYSVADRANPSTDILAGDLLLPTDGSITEIADNGFRICRSLTGIRVPDSVKRIGSEAFDCCDVFARIDLGSGLESIGTYAFYYDGFIETVTYNGDINDWYKITFEGSVSNPLYYHGDLYFKDQLVESIVVPADITDLKNSFSGCGSIKSVMIPDNSQLKTIGAKAFWWCNNSTDGLTAVYIGEGVEVIEEEAFLGSDYLKVVYIPSTVTSLSPSSFENCDALECIAVSPDNTTYASVDNQVLIESATGTLVCTAPTIKELNVSEGVTIIGEEACYDRDALTSVSLPTTITQIGRLAFGGCESLKTVDLQNISVGANSLTAIGDYAFTGCNYLESIIIPDSVTSIGANAFYNCSRLKKIYFTGTQEQWNAITKGTNWNKGANSYSIVYNYAG